MKSTTSLYSYVLCTCTLESYVSSTMHVCFTNVNTDFSVWQRLENSPGRFLQSGCKPIKLRPQGQSLREIIMIIYLNN